MPLVEPSEIDIDSVVLAENENSVENLLLEGTGAIDFSGLINYHRKQADARLLSWDERLYKVALSRALALSMNTDCWRDDAVEDTTRCARVEQLIEHAKHEEYTFKNLLENVFISVGSAVDLEHPIQAWLTSASHKNIIEHDQVKNIGVAIVKSGDAVVYVTVLGNE